MIALFAAVIVAFVVSGGFVLARQQLIQRQTTQLTPDRRARTARPGDSRYRAAVRRGRSNFRPAIHGYIETPVYAKVAGYMKTINVDKGDHVKAGASYRA